MNLSLALPEAWSASFDMTRPKVVKDLLMLEPSFSLSPTAPVLTARSEPAKSTKEIRLTFSPLTPANMEQPHFRLFLQIHFLMHDFFIRATWVDFDLKSPYLIANRLESGSKRWKIQHEIWKIRCSYWLRPPSYFCCPPPLNPEHTNPTI